MQIQILLLYSATRPLGLGNISLCNILLQLCISQKYQFILRQKYKYKQNTTTVSCDDSYHYFTFLIGCVKLIANLPLVVLYNIHTWSTGLMNWKSNIKRCSVGNWQHWGNANRTDRWEGTWNSDIGLEKYPFNLPLNTMRKYN